MKKQKIYTFKDPAPLAKAVVGWLYFDLVVNILGALATVVGLRETLSQNLSLPKNFPLSSDLWVGLMAFVQLGAMLVVGFVVLKWIYRVNRNVHAIWPKLPVSPPWSVGWFFVPVASLWKPFQAMESIWQVSTSPSARRSVATPKILRWWWGLYLASLFASNFSFRLQMMGETLAANVGSLSMDLIALLVSIPLDLVFIAIVKEVTSRQMANLPAAILALEETKPAPAP